MRVSLSARRAWIEMSLLMYPLKYGIVALRKESVDRNKLQHSIDKMSQPSLSARRAWIEISRYLDGVYFGLSLSARRAWIEISLLCRILFRR